MTFDDAAALFKRIQDEICQGLETEDGSGRFVEHHWERPGGGGGRSRVMRAGTVIEKGGVNFSQVEGDLPADFASQIPGEGTSFKATGVSLVLHPNSPMVPTTHANFRFLEKGEKRWFGGGADLTPHYLYKEDAVHFHTVWRDVCEKHASVADYPKFKKWCDDYFYLPHREETRGIGGIFFDYVEANNDEQFAAAFAFVTEAAENFLKSYIPIIQRRRDEPWGDAEKQWQRIRRGRYVEFNLIYDRGTIFGLKTNGRTESILMSLPADVAWEYMHEAEPGSREAELVAALKPIDWLA